MTISVESFTPVPALLGGVLIGLSASLLLLCQGRIAGISGILGGLLQRAPGDAPWRAIFLLGLLGCGAVAARLWPAAFGGAPRSLPLVAVAGLLVGTGSWLSGGCTSGHGVCGVGRLSRRSLVAVLTFMATGAGTMFVLRHVLGAGPWAT